MINLDYKILRVFRAQSMRLLYLKINGHQIFVNRYTRRIPFYSKLLIFTESYMTTKHTANLRKVEYKKWFKEHYPSNKLLIEQQQYKFKYRPLISVLVPTFNTSSVHLRECITSVLNQSYDNWQLCIADDASTNEEVVAIIEEYCKTDKRINLVKRQKNGHICEASNSALAIANGEFIALLDHDDILWPNALFEVVKSLNENPDTDFIYTDEDKIDEEGRKHTEPFFKPDWSPEFLRSINYITHFAVLRRSLVEKVGGFRKGYEGTQDWDLFLRVSRQTSQITHIPKVLYSWRKSTNSTAQAPSSKNYAYINQKKALEDDIKQRGYDADIRWQIPFSMWKVRYKVKNNPKVSIIIPTKDQYAYIKRCLESINKNPGYNKIEVIVADTGSSDPKVWELYDEYKKLIPNSRVIKWTKKFNFASVCNFGAKKARGEYLLFLNNDTEVITPSWVEDMLGYAQQKDIGAVGCKLLYPDGKLQHGGIILGVGGLDGTPGIAGHYYPAFAVNPPQDPAMLTYVGGTRDLTAVTAACVMVSADKFNKVNGFDEKYRIAFNDVDMCLKLFEKGWRNVYLPHVELYHHESVSVGQPGSKVRDLSEFDKEIKMMLKRWRPLIKNDPYYHPEFRKDIASARLDVK